MFNDLYPSKKPVVPGIADKHFEKERLKETPEIWEDGIRTSPGPGTFEWWYFDAHMNDGTIVVIMFFTKHINDINSRLDPFVQVRITTPDGKEYVGNDCASPGEFSASKERCEIRSGKCHVTGDLKTYTVYTETKDIVCDFVLEGIVPAWRPRTGKFYFGEEEEKYFAWLAAVPHGKVSGEITYNGKTRRVTGSGYHDHNWGNVPLTEIFNNWWWTRSRVGDKTVIAVELTTTEKYGYETFSIFMLASDGEVLIEDALNVSMNRSNVVKHPISGKTISNKLEFVYRDNSNRANLTLERKNDIFVYDYLTNLPRWKRMLAKIAGKRPWYHRFSGTVQLDLKLNGRNEYHEGETIYEFMYLGKDLG